MDLTKLKALVQDNINVAGKVEFMLDRVENVVGKGGYAGFQHFLLLTQCFHKASSSGSLNFRKSIYRERQESYENTKKTAENFSV